MESGISDVCFRVLSRHFEAIAEMAAHDPKQTIAA
jgi:hypothetical protein